jgi:S-adenosylmethionine:tRNA ribosyltransferase-isomerase
MPYRLSDYHYTLPEDRVAQHPIVPAHNSKLLVADCSNQTMKLSDHNFFELPRILEQNTLLIANNSQVFASRIILRDVQVTLQH